MSSPFDYDYLLTFTGHFDPTVIQNSNVPDKSNPAFFTAVQQKVGEMELAFYYQPQLQMVSSFINFNESRYKLNLNK